MCTQAARNQLQREVTGALQRLAPKPGANSALRAASGGAAPKVVSRAAAPRAGVLLPITHIQQVNKARASQYGGKRSVYVPGQRETGQSPGGKGRVLHTPPTPALSASPHPRPPPPPLPCPGPNTISFPNISTKREGSAENTPSNSNPQQQGRSQKTSTHISAILQLTSSPTQRASRGRASSHRLLLIPTKRAVRAF